MPLIREDTQRLCLGSETAGRTLPCGFRFGSYALRDFAASCEAAFLWNGALRLKLGR